MPERQEVGVFSYILFSGRHFPFPIAGACRTVLFVESAVCIVPENPSVFQSKLNLLQSASSSLKLGKCGTSEINNLINILLKSVRSKRNVIARTINTADNFYRMNIAFGNFSLLTAATDPGLNIPKCIQVWPPISQHIEGANECVITNQ